MDDLDKCLTAQKKDPEFDEIWETDQLAAKITCLLIAARNEQNISQTELAEKSGIRQSNISRIEQGTALPILRTLNRLANGLGKELQISFV